MKNYIIFFLSVLSCTIRVNAQLPVDPKSALTPNAASFGVYGDIPVSLFTGTPDISIPLYDIKVKDFVLPVSLTYHAAGIRPDQRAGWAGLGWALNAGGVITRAVNDMPDESNNPLYYGSGNAGYYYNYSVLNTTSWNQRSYLRSIAQNMDKSILKDTEPDEFSFHFAGYNGKFYLDHNRNWSVQCEKPVKVEFNGNFLPIPFDTDGTRAQIYGYSPCFNGFTITTEDGTKYIFGGNIDAIDFSISFFGQYIDEWIATGWYLTKIILPSKHEIGLAYERKEFNNQMYIAVHHDIYSYTEASGGFFNPQPECSSSSYPSIEASYNGKLLSPVYLTRITSNNVVVSFNKSISNELPYAQSTYSYMHSEWLNYQSYPFLPLLKSQNDGYPNCLNRLKWYKLDNIVIKNAAQTETFKTITFSYNNSSSQRLVLNSVTESGKKPYTFSYNNIGSLPAYLSNRTDHWGFYNNTYATLNYANYYNYRNPSSTYTKYGILAKIIYPTGGYTEFEFEPHYYRKQLSLNRWESCNTLSTNQLAGGLRIKAIKKSSTAEGPSQVFKEYYYVTDYLQNKTNSTVSSGILGGQVKYYFTDYIVYAFNDRDIKRSMTVFSSISVLPSCQNTPGSHIGYTEVIERNPDNSFTRYQFTNFDNGYMDEAVDAIIQQSRTPYEPYASKAKDRGNLILCEDYHSNGIKVKSKSIAYEKDATSNNYVRSMNASYKNVCPGTAVSYDEGTSYKIYTYLLRPTSATETFYNPETGAAWQSVTTSYAYTNRKLLRSTSLANSNGTVKKIEYKYPFDDTNISVSTNMVNMNALSPVREIAEYANSTLIKKDHIDYAMTNGIYYPSKISVQNGSGPIEERITFSNPDNYGNPAYSLKDGFYKTIYIWGYNGQHIIAKIENMDYSSIPSSINPSTVSSRAEPISSDWTNINNLRNNANVLVTTYKHKPAVGLTEIIDPRGFLTSYEYDSFNRLKRTYIQEGTVEAYDYHYRNQ